MTVLDLVPNKPATIKSIHVDGEIGDQLMEMGFTPGAKVTLIQHSRLGQPVQVEVRGYRVGLHSNTAECIEVTT